MRKVFAHPDSSQVGLFRSLLESSGIPAEERNFSTSALAGAVPACVVYPELWVIHDEDESRAREIIDRYRDESGSRSDLPDWTCRNCGEEVGGQFAECWNCGTPGPDAG